MINMYDSITDGELKATLEEMLKLVKKFQRLTGMEYDYDNDEYLTPNVKEEVDRDFLSTMDALGGDLSYYLEGNFGGSV